MKKAIAMRATKYQYKKISEKLKKVIKISDWDFNLKEYPYLTNNYGNPSSFQLGSHNEFMIRRGTEIHEQWNEKIFLEACGIETELTFEEITQPVMDWIKNNQHPHTMIEIYSTKAVLWEGKETNITEFNTSETESDFDTVLEVGKWYKYAREGNSSGIVFVEENTRLDGHRLGFGINTRREWKQDFVLKNDYEFILAEESEVFEALKAEAVKRGFVKGAYVEKCLVHGVYGKMDFEWKSEYNDKGQFWLGGFCLFNKGQWASTIQTITKEQAEKELNKKIIG